jgi:hypothetical protein
MTAARRSQESSVTNEIIRRVHLTLADLKSGEDILEFLRSTEPVFMDEVSRFIRIEVGRMKYHLNDQQALYVGSVIGATYIAGFLIAREASHAMFGNMFNMKPDIRKILSIEDIDKIIDKNRDEGKSHKEIARIILRMLDKDGSLVEKCPRVKKTTRGKRLDIGNLD